MNSKVPFHEKKYCSHKGIKGVCPLLEIVIGSNKESVTAYADTGCTAGLSMLESQIQKLDLGEKISDDPYKVTVADGHVVEADIYKSTISLNGVQKEVEIWVVNPNRIVDHKDKESIILLGRGFMDYFDVMFKGKEGKIALFHP